jgi:hypothetical protein
MVSVVVDKATPTIKTAPTATPINFGQTLAGATLSGGTATALLGTGTTNVAGTYSFASPNFRPSLGTAAQDVTFTPADAARYNSVTIKVNVTVDWAARAATTAGLPPQRMAYQGYLTDGAGTPLGSDGPIMANIVFRIFDSATGGNVVWAERQALVVDQGSFSALLGEGKAVDGVVNAPGGLAEAFTGAGASERYVGITVLGQGSGGTDAEILPRTRLTAAPYAYLATAAARLATSSSGAGIDFSGSTVTVPGSVAATTINASSLSVGTLTVSNSLSFSGMAGGFVSSTDVPARMIAGKHQWTGTGLALEPSPGYSVTTVGTGSYRIRFDTPFKTVPQVLATPMWNGSNSSATYIPWCQVVQSMDPTTACSEVTINYRAHGQPGTWNLLRKVGDPTTWPGYPNQNPPVIYPNFVSIFPSSSFLQGPMTNLDGDFSFLVIGN